MNPSSETSFDLFWPLVVALWLVFIVFTGGTSIQSPEFLVAHSVVAALVIVGAVWRLRHKFPGRLSATGIGLALMVFALGVAQLIPLPPEIWMKLPGRELVAKTLKLTSGDVALWMPLSLTPAETKVALLDMLPAFASFLAVMTLARKSLMALGLTLLVCAVAAVFIGLLQRNAPADSILNFYNSPGPGRVLGSFTNANFFAMQLYASLPFLAAVAMSLQERFNLRGWLIVVFASVYGAIIIAGLAVIGSRAGIALAMVSVLLSIILVYRSRRGQNNVRFSVVPILVMGALLIFGQVGMVGVLQLASTDPVADYRNSIFEVSMQAAAAFFPAGSGFGSFVPVYQLFERPETIIPSYVNHAHNDWLEIVIEGGLPATVLLAGFVMLFFMALVSVFQLAYDNSANSYFRAASVALLLILLHGIVDFGLRTPAIAAIAGLCFGLMLSARSSQMPVVTKNRNKSIDVEPLPIRPFSKPTRGFVPPRNQDISKTFEGQT